MNPHLFLATLFLCVGSTVFATDRTRLIILADMGNEPDEVQQMAQMLACSNEFDLEGLIAVIGIF